MRRWVALAVLLAVAVGCSSGGSSATSSPSASPASSSSSGGKGVYLNLDVYVPFTGRATTFGRDQAGKTCGASTSGIGSGFDERGTVEVTNRQNTVLATGDVPLGQVQDLKMSGDRFLSMTCRFRVYLPVYEQPTDLATVKFEWPAADVAFTEHVQAKDFAGEVMLKENAP